MLQQPFSHPFIKPARASLLLRFLQVEAIKKQKTHLSAQGGGFLGRLESRSTYRTCGKPNIGYLSLTIAMQMS